MDEDQRYVRDRQNAINQWKIINRTEGKCDHCSSKINQENSFLVKGPIIMIGERKIDSGNYLVCERCYKSKHWTEAYLPIQEVPPCSLNIETINKHTSNHIWQELNFAFPNSSEDHSTISFQLVNTFIITALAESLCKFPQKRFTLLLTIRFEESRGVMGVVCHMKHFLDKLKDLVDLYFSNDRDQFISRFNAAREIITKSKVSIAEGHLIPHEIELKDSTFFIEPRKYSINIPRCTTSDVLVALAAVINGCPLIFDHQGPAEFRDTLLIECLDRAGLGDCINLKEFLCHDDDPESWFLSPDNSKINE